jgi:predicted nucleic acid-binding Zn ribbon protein
VSERSEPVRISDSLAAVVRDLRDEPAGADSGRPSSAATMGGVFGRWEAAVGAAVAAHVQPVRLDGTRLVVEVDDPAWATQIRFLEANLTQRLAAVAGATIETIEVRVRRR